MINKKSPRLRASFPIMDKNFLTSNQTDFINKNGKEKATCITKIKVNASKQVRQTNKKIYSDQYIISMLDKSLSLESIWRDIYKQFCERGYIKNYQTFKELHVSNGYISKRKLKQTLNFLNKVVK